VCGLAEKILPKFFKEERERRGQGRDQLLLLLLELELLEKRESSKMMLEMFSDLDEKPNTPELSNDRPESSYVEVGRSHAQANRSELPPPLLLSPHIAPLLILLMWKANCWRRFG